MIEAALKISPDFAAHVSPALAEGEVLAEIGSVGGVDHAFEQRKPVVTSGQRVMRMLAMELQRCVMRAHRFQHVTADHQEAGAGITDPGKTVDDPDMIGIVELEHVIERSRRCLLYTSPSPRD